MYSASNLESLWNMYSSSRELDKVLHCLNETTSHSQYTQYVFPGENEKKKKKSEINAEQLKTKSK